MKIHFLWWVFATNADNVWPTWQKQSVIFLLLRSSLKKLWHYDEYITSGQNRGLEFMSPITSPPPLSVLLWEVQWLLCNREKKKNKAFDLVHARSRCEQKNLGKTLTQKLHCAVWSLWHCPYCVSPPTSVQSSSQRLTKYRCREKRTGVHPRKMPLYRHKGAGMCNALSRNGALCALDAQCARLNPNHRTFKGFRRVCRELLHKIISDLKISVEICKYSLCKYR